MCQFANSVTVEVLPPYTPSQAEKDDPVLYAANIRKLMVSRRIALADWVLVGLCSPSGASGGVLCDV